MVEWFERKIIVLDESTEDEEEKKKNVLEEMRIKLKSLTSLELDNIARGLDLGRFFRQLTSNDRAVVEEVCNTLGVLLGCLEPGEVCKRYQSEMNEFIGHPESLVRTLVLRELLKTSSAEEKALELIGDVHLMDKVVQQIESDDLGVAKLAMEVVKTVGKNPAGVKRLYSSTLLRSLAKLISKGGIVSFRVYEVVVDVAKSSESGLEASANSGFLNSLINVLDNDEDVLLQLNALEVIADLASTDFGLGYLEGQDVLKRLSDKIARADEDPLSTLLIPGLMKFFGKITKNRVDIISKYPPIILALFHVINESEDLVLLANGLDTLGHIATTNEGKYALDNLGQCMDNALCRISHVIKKMPSELRLRGLDCLAQLVHVEKHQQDNQILSLTKKWFSLIDQQPLAMIVDLCRLPFLDIKTSGYRVLAAISCQLWGLEAIASHPGLVELLLGRNNDADKTVKEIKYEIARNLADASVDVFDSATLQKFQLYVRQGPFYVDLETDVATEGAT